VYVRSAYGNQQTVNQKVGRRISGRVWLAIK
jgi:hypothetical protein